MTIENPNLLEKIAEIERKLKELEKRIIYIENRLNGFPARPPPNPDPIIPPRRPGPPPPEPFKF